MDNEHTLNTVFTSHFPTIVPVGLFQTVFHTKSLGMSKQPASNGKNSLSCRCCEKMDEFMSVKSDIEGLYNRTVQ